MNEKTFFIKRGFSDGHLRELLFNQDFLKFEANDTLNNTHIIFKKEDITDYRYGIRWIRFELTYGREYQIFIRNKENKIIKISFKSYFGRKKKALNNLYIDILEELWQFYFSEITNEFLTKHKYNEEFSVGDVVFTNEGIVFNVSGIFNQKKVTIPWEQVRTRNYHSYFSIYAANNPSEINRGYNYHEDWNTSVLYSVLRTILRDKGIENYE